MTTLINRLIPGLTLRTADISEAYDTGKHTTTTDSAFSYNTQWPNSLTEVFADSNVTLNQAVGWQQLNLQDPFYYTPTMGNLVVVVAKSIASSATNYHSAWNVTPSTNSTLTRYDIFDNGYTDTSNHTTTGMLRNTRPNQRERALPPQPLR